MTLLSVLADIRSENASGPHISDPRTGEILNADIQFYHNVMVLARDWYFTQVGPLDPRALFYLRSRGVSESEARRLLTYGFGAEVLGRMEVAPLREQLDRIVRERLAQS